MSRPRDPFCSRLEETFLRGYEDTLCESPPGKGPREHTCGESSWVTVCFRRRAGCQAAPVLPRKESGQGPLRV